MFFLLAGFLLFNLLTGTRYPFVWIDEVMYSDPAVNLYLGHGFTSSAWYVQHPNEFWAGNVPLHAVLLFLWLKIFGFSILAVRSINYVYMIAAALLLWRACIRLKLIVTSRARLLLLGLMLAGYSMVFAYRSGRPDCLTILLICGAIYIHSRECWRQRILGGASLAALIPWAGLQVLPLMAVGGVLLILYLGRKIVPAVLANWAGVALGLGTLYWFYSSHGVWNQFLLSIRQHTTIGFFGWLSRGELRHSNLVPKDFSFMIIFLLAVLMFFYQLSRRKDFAELKKSPLSFGLVYSIVLTVALIGSGKFPTYYGWMTYVPLALCICMELSKAPDGMWRWACGIFLPAAMGISIVLHGVTAMDDWRDRDYANVEKLISQNVNEHDWVYGDFSIYYAAKQRAAGIYTPLYINEFLPEEKERLTVLAIASEEFQTVTNIIGGNWISTGQKFIPERAGFWSSRHNMGFLSTQNYELEIYRRTIGK